ncbi:signal peptidase I [Nigerium massiliense]|uniref:signal peptidase I n=1 Tax=Nigerium massiliense TaxID=1522317 RepID=UPI0009077C2E|nr:signal peptidase I [Nigerium massiliense]
MAEDDESGDVRSDETKSDQGGGFRAMLKEVAIVLAGALVVSTLLRTFLLQVFVIPSPSMENTLLIEDRVAVQKVVPFQRGDIVVFTDDLEWLGVHDDSDINPLEQALMFVGLMPDGRSEHLIKRVIGMPGDHVICCDTQGRITVNGQALDERSYLYVDEYGDQQVKPSEYPFDVIVPADRIFVMGDHRNNSADSRCHLGEEADGVRGMPGFVRKESVVGTAVAVILPVDRLHNLPRPTTFSGVPAGTGAPPAQPVLRGEAPAC